MGDDDALTEQISESNQEQNTIQVAFNTIVQALWETFCEQGGLNWNHTLQISLAVFLCTLIIFTCLYRRHKIAKSAMTTL